MSNLLIALWAGCLLGRSPVPSRRGRRRSVEDDTAVDVERLPGDIAGAGRGQEHRERGDVLGLVRPPERDRRVAPPLHLLDGHALRGGADAQVAPPTDIYTLSLHDALPTSASRHGSDR